MMSNYVVNNNHKGDILYTSVKYIPPECNSVNYHREVYKILVPEDNSCEVASCTLRDIYTSQV